MIGIIPLVDLRTRAIIPVHLCGQAVDMEAIHHMAERYGLQVIEAAERAAREVLSLPMFPELTDQQTDRVVEGINSFRG